MISDLAIPSLDEGDPQDFQVSDPNSEINQRAERLKIAIRRAGGNAAVAKRSGLSLGTINNYVAGRDMKTGFMVALAKACGVNIAWLAAGEGPMTGASTPAPSPAPQNSAPFSAFVTIDAELMGQAITEAAKKFHDANRQPNGRELAQVALALYDHMTANLTNP